MKPIGRTKLTERLHHLNCIGFATFLDSELTEPQKIIYRSGGRIALVIRANIEQGTDIGSLRGAQEIYKAVSAQKPGADAVYLEGNWLALIGNFLTIHDALKNLEVISLKHLKVLEDDYQDAIDSVKFYDDLAIRGRS